MFKFKPQEIVLFQPTPGIIYPIEFYKILARYKQSKSTVRWYKLQKLEFNSEMDCCAANYFEECGTSLGFDEEWIRLLYG